MTTFSELRHTLAADLAPLGVTVHPCWPTVLDPPCAYVCPPLSTDYARRGPNFSEHTISLDVVILVAHGDATEALEVLEGLLALALINTADWALAGVDSPAPTTVSESGAEYLACVIHLSKPVTL